MNTSRPQQRQIDRETGTERMGKYHIKGNFCVIGNTSYSYYIGNISYYMTGSQIVFEFQTIQIVTKTFLYLLSSEGVLIKCCEREPNSIHRETDPAIS